MPALTPTIYSTQMAKESALTPMFEMLTSAKSATGPSPSLAQMPRPRIGGMRCECTECGAHVIVDAGRGSSGMCAVCGGSKLFRLNDRDDRE